MFQGQEHTKQVDPSHMLGKILRRKARVYQKRTHEADTMWRYSVRLKTMVLINLLESKMRGISFYPQLKLYC